MKNNIKIDELQDTVLKILDNWGTSADTLLKEAAKEIGDETAEIVQSHVDTVRTGKYKESITCEEVSTGKKYKTQLVVHAGDKMYRLSHLLENGHQVISHGKTTDTTTDAHPHFSYGEEYVDRNLEKRYREKAKL